MFHGNLLQAFNESFGLSTRQAYLLNSCLEMIENSAAKPSLVSLKAPAVLKRDFDPKFSVKWLKKDMQLMLNSVVELNVPYL
jgi:3-hydroxyisobutyrate dehydrogenase-like beta-hydroxyacid dehydrogenase